MDMDSDPIAADGRRARQRKRLGPDAACAFCGVRNPDSLTTIDRSLLQAHHVFGRANDDATTVAVCIPHHEVLTAHQRDVGVFDKDDIGPVLGPIVRALQSLGSFFVQLGQALVGFADQLLSLARLLDAHCPQWRTFTQGTN